MSHYLVCVEGPIAAGKTTILKHFQEKVTDIEGFQLVFIDEPIARWTNIAGKNLLNLFYGNQERWSFTFQVEAFMSRVHIVEEEMEKHRGVDTIFILERSWVNDRSVFGHLLHKHEKMNDMEWDVYTTFHNWIVRNAPAINKIVYLDTDPETCLERKKYRARKEEDHVPDDYILEVAQRYQEVAGTCQIASDDYQGLEDILRSMINQPPSSCQ
jgi:deoxyadenosine/deoxycytidine kinase